MAGSIGEVQLDALPYSDQGYEEPGVREMVSFKKIQFDNSCILILSCRLLEWLRTKLSDTGQQKITWNTFLRRHTLMKLVNYFCSYF